MYASLACHKLTASCCMEMLLLLGAHMHNVEIVLLTFLEEPVIHAATSLPVPHGKVPYGWIWVSSILSQLIYSMEWFSSILKLLFSSLLQLSQPLDEIRGRPPPLGQLIL